MSISSRIQMWLKYHAEEYTDKDTGVLNHLKLADACIAEFDISNEAELVEAYEYAKGLRAKEIKPDLKALRRRAGFSTQKLFAKAAGLAPSTVWLAENNQAISRESAKAMLTVLKNAGIDVGIDDIDWYIH